MQPQQQYQNPYEFITSSPKKSWQPFGGLSGGSMGTRIALIAGLFVIVIMVIVLAYSLLSGGGGAVNVTLVAQDQNEVARVANIAVQTQQQAVQQETTLDFATTCAMSVTSDQSQLLSFLTAHGVKLNTKTLALRQNSTVDSQLATAASSNTFDQTFLPLMQQELTVYETDIKTAYVHSSNPAEKQLLANEYQNAQTLLTQEKNALTALNSANN